MKAEMIEHPDRSFGSMGPLSEDPVLARVEGDLDRGETMSSAFTSAGAYQAYQSNQQSMNMLAGLMAGSSRSAPVQTQSSQGSSLGPAIAAGAAGLAIGVIGGAIAATPGEKKAESPETATETTAAEMANAAKPSAEAAPTPGGGEVPAKIAAPQPIADAAPTPAPAVPITEAEMGLSPPQGLPPSIPMKGFAGA